MAKLRPISKLPAQVWAWIALSPDKGAGRRRFARRERRGVFLVSAALGLFLWIGAVSMWVNHLAHQERLSRAEGLAAGIAELSADFDFYVHRNSAGFTAELELAGTSAATLSAGHLTAFTANNWRFKPASLGAAPSGWSISLDGVDIALGVAREADGALPVGILVLGVQSGEPDALIDDLRNALVARSSQNNRDVLNATDEAGAILLGVASLTTGQTTLSTPAMSGLHSDLVLREARVGHALNIVLDTPLMFDTGRSDRNLSNAGKVVVGDAQVTGCTIALSRCVNAAQTHIVTASQTLTSLDTGGNLFAFGDANIGSASALANTKMNNLSTTGALVTAGNITVDTAADLTSGQYGSMVATDVFGSDIAGTATQTTVLNVATATTLATTELVSTSATLGHGASRSPAVQAPLLVSKVAGFGAIETMGCNGC